MKMYCKLQLFTLLLIVHFSSIADNVASSYYPNRIAQFQYDDRATSEDLFIRFEEAASSGELEKAATYLKLAAQNGHSSAQFLLGSAYRNPNGNTIIHKGNDKEFPFSALGIKEPHYQLAADYFKKAADQGNPFAQNELAWCYYEGRGVPLSYDLAYVWFQKSANAGNLEAMMWFGILLCDGEGCEANEELGIKWIMESAEKGYVPAMNDIALRYLDMGNYAIAAQWLHKAAKQNDASAQAYLIELYEEGIGVPKDLSKATEFAKSAANQAHPLGCLKLGMFYLKGIGVKQNLNQAKLWLTQALERGIQQFNLEEEAIEALKSINN